MFERVKELCNGENGKPHSITELAERLGWNTTYIYKWSYQKPPYDRVYAVAKELDVSMEYLIEGDERVAEAGND